MLLPKKKYIRNKKWREFVSQQPCIKCKLEGSSQAAHLGSGGRGIKSGDDTCVSLCTVHPDPSGNLILGCHERLDRHLEPHYWNENKQRAIATARQAYSQWSEGLIDLASNTFRSF